MNSESISHPTTRQMNNSSGIVLSKLEFVEVAGGMVRITDGDCEKIFTREEMVALVNWWLNIAG